MFYRENGQFKTSYRADQQIFPIRQDRIAILLIIAFALFVVPFFASNYFLSAILIPFIILFSLVIAVRLHWVVAPLWQVVPMRPGTSGYVYPRFHLFSSY